MIIFDVLLGSYDNKHYKIVSSKDPVELSTAGSSLRIARRRTQNPDTAKKTSKSTEAHDYLCTRRSPYPP